MNFQHKVEHLVVVDERLLVEDDVQRPLCFENHRNVVQAVRLEVRVQLWVVCEDNRDFLLDRLDSEAFHGLRALSERFIKRRVYFVPVANTAKLVNFLKQTSLEEFAHLEAVLDEEHAVEEL